MPQRTSIGGSLLLASLFAVFAAPFLSAPLSAQMHKVAPPEKVTRAVAVYEWTGDLAHPTAARLVPVTIFINGHLEDAGVYLTQPMPFALQTGDVYSIEHAGLAQGTVDIDYARNMLPARTNPDVALPGSWYGYGAYAPLPPPPKPTALKPSAHPPVIAGSDDDSRPHFTGKQPGLPDEDPKPSAKSSPPSADDPDRPHMTRRTDTASTSTDPGTVPADDPDRPTLRHRDPKDEAKQKKRGKESGSGVEPMSTSLNDDTDRPTMHRGKPTGTSLPAELKTLAPDLHQVVAVSDPANHEPHIFTRQWDSPTDRSETLAKLETLAQTHIATYCATWRLTPIPARSLGAPDLSHSKIGASTASSVSAPTPHTTTHKTQSQKPKSPAPPPPSLDTEDLTGYTLSYGGLPTFVYTAQSPITIGGPVYITLVAQRLPSGELQVALSSVTDAAHLDRTPWLRLVDAVDPDWSHRADLLFELRAQTTRQFALYRLTTAHAEQQFITSAFQ